jgi:hypothetical protein
MKPPEECQRQIHNLRLIAEKGGNLSASSNNGDAGELTWRKILLKNRLKLHYAGQYQVKSQLNMLWEVSCFH